MDRTSYDKMSSLSVKGKVAIVTGAGSGINLAFAKLLLSQGCSVVIGDISLLPAAEDLLKQYPHEQDNNKTPSAIYHRTDVTSWPQLSSLFTRTLDLFSRVDIVVPGAGIFEPPFSAFWHAPVTATNPDSPSRDPADGEPGSYKSLEINLTHPIRLSQLAVGHWTTKKIPGTLVLVSSIAGHTTGLSNPLYFASKAGVHAFVRSLGSLRDTLNIRISAVAPGPVNTPLWTGDKKILVQGKPELLVEPETIAEAMLDLCQDPDFGNGTILEILKDHRRVVPEFNAPPPPAHTLDMTSLEKFYNDSVERLKRDGLPV
ncbi:short chain dehydrogenase [Poronia punctata]|nr:short chain dehydrogenase [Poronia punctata]